MSVGAASWRARAVKGATAWRFSTRAGSALDRGGATRGRMESAGDVEVTLVDLRPLLKARYDRVRLHALEIVRHQVEQDAPSASAIVDDALRSLRDEPALAIRQLLLGVVSIHAERTQRFPEAAASFVDRAIRDALKGDGEAAAVTSSVFTMIRT